VKHTNDAADALIIDPGDGHGRSALAGVRALAAVGRRVAVATYGPVALASASRYADVVVRVPHPEEPGFEDAVAAAVAGLGALAVLPAADAALVALHSLGHRFVDKTALLARAIEAGIDVPPTMLVSSGTELIDRAAELDFPVVVKPAVPAFPARRFEDRASLSSLEPVLDRLLAQPALDGDVFAIGGVVCRGELVAAVHQRATRTWPTPCGTASAALTVEPDPGMEGALVRLLDGYEGIFQAQFVDGYLLDLNPRLYGSLPLAVAAGANLPAVWLDLLAGREVSRHRARPDVRYRWLEGDLRHVATQVRSGAMSAREATRALLPHRATAHSVESLKDPKPMITRFRSAARSRSALSSTREPARPRR